MKVVPQSLNEAISRGSLDAALLDPSVGATFHLEFEKMISVRVLEFISNKFDDAVLNNPTAATAILELFEKIRG